MSKQVLVCREDFRVFGGLQEASESLGVTPVTVSRAVKDCRECKGVVMRWAERIYAAKLKSGEWRVVAELGSGRGYKTLDDRMERIAKADVVSRRELTESWYQGER